MRKVSNTQSYSAKTTFNNVKCGNECFKFGVCIAISLVRALSLTSYDYMYSGTAYGWVLSQILIGRVICLRTGKVFAGYQLFNSALDRARLWFKNGIA